MRRGPALLALALCAAAAVPSAAGAYTTSDLPDLVPMLPSFTGDHNPVPVYVDTLRLPGRVLYRFDAVIWIRAGSGALDVYRDPATGQTFQIVWNGGLPPGEQNPNELPSGSNWTAVDRTAAGASLFIIDGTWHFGSAALYSVQVPGGPPRISDKVGFCFFDTWGAGVTSYYKTFEESPYQSWWCRQDPNGSQLVRMGVSPGLGDYYWSQLKYQWVDVTDLPPGEYTLRAQVNPGNVLLEQDYTNNRLDDVRMIPGATADSAGEQVPSGGTVQIPLSGTIVGADVPVRNSDQGACVAPDNDIPADTCWGTTTGGAKLSFAVVRGPAHGTVRIQETALQRATAVYTPAPGYSGADSFTYRTTDPRGLASLPATVTLQVLAPGGGTPGGGGGGTTPGTGPTTSAPALRVGLRTIGTARVGKLVRFKVTLSRSTRLKVTLQLRQGRRYRNLMSRQVTRTKNVVAFRPKARGRYVLRLRYTLGGRVRYSAPIVLNLRG